MNYKLYKTETLLKNITVQSYCGGGDKKNHKHFSDACFGIFAVFWVFCAGQLINGHFSPNP